MPKSNIEVCNVLLKQGKLWLLQENLQFFLQYRIQYRLYRFSHPCIPLLKLAYQENEAAKVSKCITNQDIREPILNCNSIQQIRIYIPRFCSFGLLQIDEEERQGKRLMGSFFPPLFFLRNQRTNYHSNSPLQLEAPVLRRQIYIVKEIQKAKNIHPSV